MTARPESRHQQAQRIQQQIRQRREAEALRDRLAFQRAVADMVRRAENRPPPPPPPPDPVAVSPRRPQPPRQDKRVWWSNRPVLGYRIWEMRGGLLHGAWTRWEEPTKTAICLDKRTTAKGPVPHDATECRHPPCGIYSLKTTNSVRDTAESIISQTSVPVTLAIGLVAMSGRVIEHEFGYRAERVEVAALAFLTGSVGTTAVLATIDDPDGISRAFNEPRQARAGRDLHTYPVHQAVGSALAHLRERADALA